MKPWPSKAFLLGGAAALVLAIPALGQESPESLLPPGFEEPVTPPPQQQEPKRQPSQGQPSQGQAPPPGPALPGGLADLIGSIENPALEDLEAMEKLPRPVEIPDEARRAIDPVGVLTADGWGLQSDAYRASNGRFLTGLMRRLDAPLPSRWASILLRRSLLTRAEAPAYVHPVDWVAERAWLLLRMGEADGARMLVQAVDVDRFTPKMYQVAVQTALATADPAALCPLIEGGRTTSNEPVWDLSEAMCAALAGDAGRASALIDQARRRGRATIADLTFAEKVVGSGIDTRRAVTIEWDGVDRLNSWRFGLAAATGVEIPSRLLENARPHVLAWQARAPMYSVDQRVAAAEIAASLGVFSNASLVEMHSLIGDSLDPSEISQSMSERLRLSYTAPTLEGRVNAMRGLWNEAEDPISKHARLVLTAAAAARLRPSAALENDAANLIASMLTAGFDRHAARWSPIVEAMDEEDADRGWALLAIASPDPRVEISRARISRFADRDGSKDSHRTRMLVAALAGLRRIDARQAASLADDLDIRLAARNSWTMKLEEAVRRRQPGAVVLLVAIGLQTRSWESVPPEHLFHIVRALRLAGREYEARMIAAEALSRL